MKFNIIIPYRDREEHLRILIPRLHMVFINNGYDFDITVTEQADRDPFKKTCIINEAVKQTEGDILVLHDVDYYPYSPGCKYYDGTSEVYLPVNRAIFTTNGLVEKKLEDVPSGYRHFKDGVDDNFMGGVIVIKREAFVGVNGMCPLFTGWGFEDSEFRTRLIDNGVEINRDPSNLFYALEHADSHPGMSDRHLRSNMVLAEDSRYYRNTGLSTHTCDVKDGKWEYNSFVRHLRCNNFRSVNSNIVPSNLGF